MSDVAVLFRIHPIHWQATHNDAMIVAQGQELAMTDEESAAIQSLLGDLLPAYGLTLQAAGLWMANGSADLSSVNPKPLQQIMHCSLLPHLLSLDQSLKWQQMLTEVQMGMSNLVFNQTRLSNGLPTINGIWLERADNKPPFWQRLWRKLTDAH